jgi:lipopolysaccharide export LptBFGC system permease protein LptF
MPACLSRSLSLINRDGTREGNKNKSSMSTWIYGMADGMQERESGVKQPTFSYLNFRQQRRVLSQFVSLLVYVCISLCKEAEYDDDDDDDGGKKLHSSRDNNAQIGNFPIYDKI